MAIKVKGQLKEAQLENLASDPANLPHGRAWYDTAINKLKVSIFGVAKIIPTIDSTDTITNKSIDADANTITNIENADIKSAAAISLNKLAATTASRALVSDASGFVSPSATTDTEIGHVSGVTSSIQTQLNAKAPSASPTFTGTVTVPATITAPSAVVVTLPTTTSTLATLGLTETFTGAKTLQNLTVTTNPITLTSGQIAFPATQLASAGANTLDDYEEGTWTPAWNTGFPSNPTSITARYTKIGQIVHVTCECTATIDGTTLAIGGLPFTAATPTTQGVATWYGTSNTLKGQVNGTSLNFVVSATYSSGATSLGAVYKV